MSAAISPISAVVLGIVEGLTEFLPVSSTGHLIVAGAVLGTTDEAVKTFDVVIQFGAIFAAIIYYRKILLDLAQGLLKRDAACIRLVISLAIACAPAGILGLVASKAIKRYLFGTRPVAFALIAGGIFMIAVELYRRRNRTRSQVEDLAAVTPRHALIVGLAQCASLWPGTSRSMSTIVGGQLAGLSTPVAADFAFLAGIPLLTAACLHDLLKDYKSLMTDVGGLELLLGLLVSLVVGWIVIAGFLRYLRSRDLIPFGIYRIAFGLAVLFILLPGAAT